MKRKTIAIGKLALMLEAELGAGTLAALELETDKPPMFWTLMEKFLHLLVGYCPTEKLWNFVWELDGFHCRTSMFSRALPVSLDDLREKFVKPTAAKMWKNVRKQREAANADA